MSKRVLLGALAVFVAAVAVFVVMAFDSETGRVGVKAARAECTKADASECLPHLTFVDVDKNEYSPEALKDKVVIVNFWATWCRPCQAEIPAFARVYQRYRDRGVELLAVQMDYEGRPPLDAFAEQYGINFPVIEADSAILDAFAWPERLPTTFVYDRSHRLVHGEPGALSEAELTAILDELLDG